MVSVQLRLSASWFHANAFILRNEGHHLSHCAELRQEKVKPYRNAPMLAAQPLLISYAMSLRLREPAFFFPGQMYDQSASIFFYRYSFLSLDICARQIVKMRAGCPC